MRAGGYGSHQQLVEGPARIGTHDHLGLRARDRVQPFARGFARDVGRLAQGLQPPGRLCGLIACRRQALLSLFGMVGEFRVSGPLRRHVSLELLEAIAQGRRIFYGLELCFIPTAAQAGEPLFEPALGLFQARRQGRQLAYRIGVVVTEREKPPGLVRRELLGSGR